LGLPSFAALVSKHQQCPCLDSHRRVCTLFQKAFIAQAVDALPEPREPLVRTVALALARDVARRYDVAIVRVHRVDVTDEPWLAVLASFTRRPPTLGDLSLVASRAPQPYSDGEGPSSADHVCLESVHAAISLSNRAITTLPHVSVGVGDQVVPHGQVPVKHPSAVGQDVGALVSPKAASNTN